jgi:hypothetical protein
MFFESKREAMAYAKSQTQDMRGVYRHKVEACNQWIFDRVSGDYSLVPRWHVVLG